MSESQSDTDWMRRLASEESQRRALESRVAELESRTEASARFLAVISHEIRNALNGALGMAEILAGSELSEEQRARVQVIRESGESLRSLVNDILDYSKLEEGKLELERTPFQMASLIQGCVAMTKTDADRKGLELSLTLRPDGADDWVLGDSGRLRQVALNLLHNAIKFTDRGRIQVECVIEPSVPTDGPTRWRLTVEDSGIGLSSVEREALFQPFSKTLSAQTRPRGGAGLGLAICHRLIESMGGAIGVDSVPGQGATFWVELSLPRATPSAPSMEPAWDLTQGADSLRILVADDSRVNLRIAEAMLRHMGHDPHCVENGEQALEAVTDQAFDLIFMDLWMPEMDGVQAARAIRDLPDSKAHIPIVALTANAAPADSQRCHDAGMNGLVSKPIQPKDLRNAIAQHAKSRT